MDHRRGKQKKFGGWKLYLWQSIYLLAVIYNNVQGIVRFLSFLMFRREEVALVHLPAQFDATILPLVHFPVLIMIYGFNSDLPLRVLNEMYDSSEDEASKARRRLRTLPVLEQLISGIGFMGGGGVLFYGIILLFLNDMSHLLINMELLQFLKSSTIAVLFKIMLETWSFGIWVTQGVFMISCSCLILSKVETTLNKRSENLRYDRKVSMRRLLSKAQKVQLRIQLFNKINCWNVQALKVNLF